MTDRELLELSAKAAGIIVRPVVIEDIYGEKTWVGLKTKKRSWFDPLMDDGDAFRLLVYLEFRLKIDQEGVVVESPIDERLTIQKFLDETMELGKRALVRRAIVRAAAAIGRKM